MSEIKSLLAAYWPVLVPSVLILALVMSRTARRLARTALRLVSRPLLLLAVIALVYDGTRTMSANSGGIVITSLGEHWSSLAPTSYQNTQTMVRRRLHPAIWDTGLAPILRLPTWLVFGGFGFGLAWAGRRRREVEVFAN